MQEAIGRLDGVALLMGSGFCDFCQTWHSAGCCHPGRRVLAEKDRQIDQLRAKLIWQEDLLARFDKQEGRIAALEERLEKGGKHLEKLAELNDKLRERLAAWRDIVPMLKALIPSSHDVPAVGIYLPWQYIQKLKDLEEI